MRTQCRWVATGDADLMRSKGGVMRPSVSVINMKIWRSRDLGIIVVKGKLKMRPNL